ncbi:VCBS repeat-containing protein [Chryseolinea sp. H1M3-3]|uniref:VCBS repeat-containing protein n=1 Tax=Chryseolinea sp. H1M3-3 TaxID=3034144 RepID=UPI0023ECD164|nr:VCBS repeat-containing protein [Chryseolinea sp. H1M3-3]
MISRITFLVFSLIIWDNFLFAQETPLFEQLSPSKTGVTFKNMLKETPASNVLTYEYFFNGGGTAIGDINNDGLDDIYFTSNMGSNKLYLNQGSFKFNDITKSAGVACNDGWKTGVTMADVNGDGFIDIYVCYSGKGDPNKRRNKLFINNGNLTFTDKAREYGLDDAGYATHASFFDFDRDGDLDMYQLNHNVVVIRGFQFAKAKETRDPFAGDKFFRNDNGRFTDISEAAGIKGNPLGFGLGITVADINKDGWLDMYVSNDYVEPDYLYINNHNGTFTDRLTDYMQHISQFSMGCDVSDINNDTWPDIFTVDMLPEDNKRQKLLYGPENYEQYSLMVLNGFYFQNMRNMLHLNNGNGTYSEIGQFAGISKTDWSWAPLFADYDNDGLKDLFITNGYFRDYTNRDFLKYKGDYYFEKGKAKEKADTFHLVSTMTSTPLHNYIYKNNGDLTFTDKSAVWGFKELNFSNGAAYSDLDNDGDLDLIINNENATASIHKNLSREQHPEINYLQLSLTGTGRNTKGTGAKITLFSQGKSQYFEKIPSRGFQSSVTDRIHVGLGSVGKVDSIKIIWMSGQHMTLRDVQANQILKIPEENSIEQRAEAISKVAVETIFTPVEPTLNYTHAEPGFNDFKRQPLLMTMLTTCGPIMAQGDINNDGLADVFVGGAQENPAKIFIQNKNGTFDESMSTVFNKLCTDADAVFFDADGDRDQDLYVVSGGYNDYEVKDKALKDRLYVNDGTGKFLIATDGLPDMVGSKACVAASDFDHDGDLDLFVGGRVLPGKYPVTPESYLLLNNGGRFENVTATKASRMSMLGMVSDAKWVDVNGDHWDDLVVIGEFMSIEVFTNNQGKTFERTTETFFERDVSGLWNKMIAHDFDKDGDLDLIVGNLGLNTQLRASEKEPLTLVYKDFDNNGSVDPILNYYVQGKEYPFPSRDELLDQMYSMRSKFTDYASYSNARLEDIFSANDLKDAKRLKATLLESVYLENKQGKFEIHELPHEAQFSPIYAMTIVDYNKDGNMDLITGGNQSSIRIRMGVIDANFGQLFQGDGKGNFVYVPQPRSGLSSTGDTKSLQMINVRGDDYLLIGINNVGVKTYKLNR